MTTVRSKILVALDKATKRLTVNELTSKTGGSWSTVSRALRELRKRGKVVSAPLLTNHPPRRWTLWSSASAAAKAAAPLPTTKTNTKGKKADMTLEQAVETVIADFVKGNKSFSAHEITKELRARVNTGLVIDSAPTVRVDLGGGKHVDASKIEHDQVRDLVVTQFQTGAITGYTRQNTGTFWVYEPANAPGQAAIPAAPASTQAALPSADGLTYDGTPVLAPKP